MPGPVTLRPRGPYSLAETCVFAGDSTRHFRDGEPSLELALTAHVLPVLELDLLQLIERVGRGGGPSP